MTTRQLTWLTTIAISMFGAATGQLVSAQQAGHPIVSWRLPVAIGLGFVGGVVISLVGDLMRGRQAARRARRG